MKPKVSLAVFMPPSLGEKIGALFWGVRVQKDPAFWLDGRVK